MDLKFWLKLVEGWSKILCYSNEVPRLERSNYSDYIWTFCAFIIKKPRQALFPLTNFLWSVLHCIIMCCFRWSYYRTSMKQPWMLWRKLRMKDFGSKQTQNSASSTLTGETSINCREYWNNYIPLVRWVWSKSYVLSHLGEAYWQCLVYPLSPKIFRLLEIKHEDKKFFLCFLWYGKYRWRV